MKKVLALVIGVGLIALLIGSVAAREIANPGKRPVRDWSSDESLDLVDPGLRGLYETAAADTYCMVWYTFETNNWMGWTPIDNTAQVDTFFHVDDFAGLGTSWTPLEGLKSMWCGAEEDLDDPYMCSWEYAPGYGNYWNQMLTSDPFAFQGTISFTYTIRWDSEPGYDYTRIEYDAGGGSWVELAEFDDLGDSTGTVLVYTTQARTKLRFHFTADGAWSDQDGLWNTNGACVVDALRIQDAATLNLYENFETAAVDAKDAGIWHARPETPYGSFAGLYTGLTDKDPCGDNFGTQVVFFVGSSEISTSYPGLFDTPFCTGPGGTSAPCQDEGIVSPIIDMTMYSTLCNNVQDGTIPSTDLNLLGGAILRFTSYRDLPLSNLVFYTWSVRSIIDGCPGQWVDDNFVYYGADMDYIYGGAGDVSKFIGGNDPVQIRIGCTDMCDAWYNTYGNCAAHTPSPWVDNVRLYRYKTAGPQWGSRDLDFFQDNFPEAEYNIESYVRCDAANDIFAGDNPVIHPGDSLVVDCTSIIADGLKEDNTFGGASVYINVRASYIGPAPTKPALSGAALAGSVLVNDDPETYVNFNYVSTSGAWTKIQCDTARTGAGIVDGKYMVDLNDELFTRGYKIDYYFTATDKKNVTSAYPRYSRSGPPYFEWTCLPTLNTDVLFVDDGYVELYWLPVFDAVLALPDAKIDIYDVNAPSSGVSNGPGSRAKNYQLRSTYETIVWDCGAYESVTISEGTAHSDKSNDCQMLVDWMSLSEHQCGLWVCGDDIAFDLDGAAGGSALLLMSSWCGVDYVATSYFEETGGRLSGGVVTPLLTGNTDSGIFVHSGVPDKLYASGACFIINQFDCLEKTAGGKYALSYPAYLGTNYYGAISKATTNTSGFPVRTMWFGFSYAFVRDDVNTAPMDKFEIANDVLVWMQNETNLVISGNETPSAYALAQNFPNPFNPSTTIRIDMREKGFVTLKIYNVAGQLVRTLVDGVKDAGSYNIAWDGMNDRGGAVASGIYFYKMETKDFSQTKKMVMLR